MKIEFVTYETLPLEIQTIKNNAFSHSKLSWDAQKMDNLGRYTCLYVNDKFIGGVNTLTNEKPVELGSNYSIKIEEDYLFFCRGFIGNKVRKGLGAIILLLLSMEIIEVNNYNILTSVRKKNKSIVKMLNDCGYTGQQSFSSYHQLDTQKDLLLFKFIQSKQFANEKKAELISYLQQKL